VSLDREIWERSDTGITVPKLEKESEMALRNYGLRLPDEGSHVQYDVVYPKEGMPIDATILAEIYTGFAVHWIPATKTTPRRTRLCTLAAGCEWHKNSPPAVWTGYLQVFNNLQSKQQILTLTAHAARMLGGMYARLIGLRGNRVICCREGDKPRGQVLIARAANQAVQPLANNFDMGSTLMTIFGVSCLPELLTEGADRFDAAPMPTQRFVDDRLPWEKGGAS
jgi:hypothetical protein